MLVYLIDPSLIVLGVASLVYDPQMVVLEIAKVTIAGLETCKGLSFWVLEIYEGVVDAPVLHELRIREIGRHLPA